MRDCVQRYESFFSGFCGMLGSSKSMLDECCNSTIHRSNERENDSKELTPDPVSVMNVLPLQFSFCGIAVGAFA